MAIPCYIIEEHNEAFEIWLNAACNEVINPSGNVLLHFDEHSDMFVPRFENSINNLLDNSDSIKPVSKQLGIASFIVPAIYLGLINDVKWIKQDVIIPAYNDMYVCSVKNEGIIIMMGKLTDAIVEGSKNSNLIHFSYSKISEQELHAGSVVTNDVLLDIDLDYFSSIENPADVKPVVIEITKDEYDDFINNKYHPLIFLMNKIEAVDDDGKYYYIINNYTVNIYGNRKTTIETVKKRVNFFKETLIRSNVKPKLITVCRSRHSGYTPKDQWEEIEKMVLEALHELYPVNEYCLTE